MFSLRRGSLHLPLTLLLSTLLLACSDSNNNNNSFNREPELTYQADIVWTEYGIPHITAQDWGSLGYGYAYAYARENYCVVMKAYVEAAGESARYFGDEGDLNADLNYKMFNSDETIEQLQGELPEFMVDDLRGYAAGLNVSAPKSAPIFSPRF
jgi:acyl-homoserine-lactone acylase